MRGLGFPEFTLCWQIGNARAGTRAQEGESGVTPAVSYLSSPGLSKRGASWGDSLVSLQVVLLAAVLYSW